MEGILISFSEVKVPIFPYKQAYIVGIVKNKKGQQFIVQIDKKHREILSIGMRGDIKLKEGAFGKLNTFIPKTKNIKKKNKVNKVALITGSSRGIGEAIAIELAKDGFYIIVNNALHIEEGMEVVNKIKKMKCCATYIQADVSDPDQVDQMIKRIIKELGRIDVLVNNAGITMDQKLENMTIEKWNKVLSVNLTGVFNCTKAVIKIMQRQGGGKIINVSSIVGKIGNIGQANYAASKGGIIAFTKTVAKEYAKDGIIVNAIAPGFIKTKMLETIPKEIMKNLLDQIPLGRLGEPWEVAKLVSFLVSDNANYITGQVIDINGGLCM